MRTAAFLGSAAALLGLGQGAQAQDLSELAPDAVAVLSFESEMSPSEEAAFAVVMDWVGGWDNRSTDQVAGAMTPDVYWAGGFPGNPPLGIWRTGDRFVQQDGRAVSGGILFTVDEVFTAGGSRGTAILHRRPDEAGFGDFMNLGGGDGVGTYFVNAVFNWVVDDKIVVWLDGPVLFPPVPRDEAPSIDAWDAEEAEAMAVVEDWVAGWNARDPAAVASLMTENVQFSTNYPEYITEITREHFLESRSEGIAAGVDMEIADGLAIGGPEGIAVLIERTDRFTVDGQEYEVPTAGFFWLEEGLITTWLDFPLEAPPEDASGNLIVR